MTRLSAITLAAMVLTAAAASAQSPLGSASGFAALGSQAVTCTDTAPADIVTGDVGVVVRGGFTNTACTIIGTVHDGDAAAAEAYVDFLSA